MPINENRSDNYWTGTNTFGGPMRLTPGTVDNAAVAAGAAIDTAKLLHRHALRYTQNGGSDVVAASVPLHVARAAGVVFGIELSVVTPPAGGDKEITVDLQKGNAATGFATVLSAVMVVDSGVAAREVVTGVIASEDYADGDTLLLVVAASGSTGTQAQGLVVTLTLNEEPS